MFRETQHLLFFPVLVIFVALSAAKAPPLTPIPWMNYAPKPGPPTMTGIDTIPVPYISKPSLFPKFVDPKMMINKKTDLLNNLFGGLGPVGFGPFAPYGSYSIYGGNMPTSKNIGWAQGDFPSQLIDSTGRYKRSVSNENSELDQSPMSVSTQKKEFQESLINRKRRSVDSFPFVNNFNLESDKPEVKTFGPPPAYPGLSPIPEESETGLYKTKVRSIVPKEYLSATFPSSGPGPMFDSASMISKKSTFLDNLFNTIGVPPSATTDVPIPKSTIVPPTFWIPSSIIPGPTEYTDKVSVFLGKLFDSLKLKNATSIPLNSKLDPSDTRIARSVEDLSSIAAAKDAIVDNILSELTDLKGGMLTTMNDMIAYQKTMGSVMNPLGAKKSVKPFASIWTKSVDTTLPFQQRMTILSQVFDMLTELQKNITSAVDVIWKNNLGSSKNSDTFDNIFPSSFSSNVSPIAYDPSINLTLLDMIKQKLADIQMNPNSPTKIARSSPMSESPFWMTEQNVPLKRQISEETNTPIENEDRERRQYARGVQMKMHQGYQSLPAGSVESVQAGGGSVPGHQGGGIKLLNTADDDLNKWADWRQYISQNENQDDRQHHHH